MEHTGWPPRRMTAAHAAVVAALVTGAVAWIVTDRRMAGMDEGPGTDLGSLGFYATIWIVMMAAMMLPSAAPMVAAHAMVQRRKRELGRGELRGASAAFAGGYLIAWAAFGLAAYALFDAIRALDIEAFSWDRWGRYLAAGAVAIAAVYQLTPLKDVCLAKCRTPLAFVVGSWRTGRFGAVRMGTEYGGWCIGCCWALMATLFALGLMSIVWTVTIAAVVGVEKLLPWNVTRGVALLLAVLALGVALVPDQVPGLTVPGQGGMTMDH